MYVRPSGLTSQVSARSGTTFKSRSKVTRPPYISFIYIIETASVATCGSSVGGSLPNLTKEPPWVALSESFTDLSISDSPELETSETLSLLGGEASFSGMGVSRSADSCFVRSTTSTGDPVV